MIHIMANIKSHGPIYMGSDQIDGAQADINEWSKLMGQNACG